MAVQKLVSMSTLQDFTEEIIVPINETISSLATALGALSDVVDDNAADIAPEEKSPALAAHALGSYIYYDGDLYKVISAIDIGDTLTANTNIQQVTVAGELVSIAGSLATINTRLNSMSDMTNSEVDSIIATIFPST